MGAGEGASPVCTAGAAKNGERRIVRRGSGGLSGRAGLRGRGGIRTVCSASRDDDRQRQRQNNA